jgi:hypothetical protein
MGAASHGVSPTSRREGDPGDRKAPALTGTSSTRARNHRDLLASRGPLKRREQETTAHVAGPEAGRRAPAWGLGVPGATGEQRLRHLRDDGVGVLGDEVHRWRRRGGAEGDDIDRAGKALPGEVGVRIHARGPVRRREARRALRKRQGNVRRPPGDPRLSTHDRGPRTPRLDEDRRGGIDAPRNGIGELEVQAVIEAQNQEATIVEAQGEGPEEEAVIRRKRVRPMDEAHGRTGQGDVDPGRGHRLADGHPERTP